MIAILQRMVTLLSSNSNTEQDALDPQALSNSIWAIAHIRSQQLAKPHFEALERSETWQVVVTQFLLLMAGKCHAMLSRVAGSLQGVPRPSPHVVSQDSTFTCQVCTTNLLSSLILREKIIQFFRYGLKEIAINITNMVPPWSR